VKLSTPPKPKQLSLCQTYSKLFYREKVEARADSEWNALPTTSRKNRLAFNNEITKAVYNAETAEVKKEILEHRDALHAEAIEAWKLATEAIEDDDSSYP